MKDIPYGRWREYDPEDTVRFCALRAHETGMIRSSPQQIIAQGSDPKGLIRDPAANQCVKLPVAERDLLINGLTRDEFLRHPLLGRQYAGDYVFQAGQPEDVQREYEAALGIVR